MISRPKKNTYNSDVFVDMSIFWHVKISSITVPYILLLGTIQFSIALSYLRLCNDTSQFSKEPTE